ncbi:hypothetical protein TREES_T100011913 [Tupaia chinensis]|uniref:Uncharacterized protein n=1 Tax=Tupaia chinensis TaxID=246437 RepID=L9KU00_TUPCH|nr:hypothetical protein TREES_T100011913 [Tupaia chinensis]
MLCSSKSAFKGAMFFDLDGYTGTVSRGTQDGPVSDLRGRLPATASSQTRPPTPGTGIVYLHQGGWENTNYQLHAAGVCPADREGFVCETRSSHEAVEDEAGRQQVPAAPPAWDVSTTGQGVLLTEERKAVEVLKAKHRVRKLNKK